MNTDVRKLQEEYYKTTSQTEKDKILSKLYEGFLKLGFSCLAINGWSDYLDEEAVYDIASQMVEFMMTKNETFEYPTGYIKRCLYFKRYWEIKKREKHCSIEGFTDDDNFGPETKSASDEFEETEEMKALKDSLNKYVSDTDYSEDTKELAKNIIETGISVKDFIETLNLQGDEAKELKKLMSEVKKELKKCQ